MKLFEKIEKNLINLKILPILEDCGTVLCALSGGADSVVLLRFLRQYLPARGIRLAAAHLNHCIRGAEADADEAFCRSLCDELEIPFYCRRADIPALAKNTGQGLEECARSVRYAFFEEIRSSIADCVIATAHNATDHLETVLFHLARGTGARGLCGISPVRDGYIIRPLLCCTSQEIRAYAAEEGIAYVTDRTNEDTAYTRNYIRKNMIPAMQKINPRCEEAALRMSASLADDLTCLESAASRLLSPEGFIQRDAVSDAPPALLSRGILAMYRNYTGSAANLSQVHLSDCMSLIRSGKTGRISLPGQAVLLAEENCIRIGAQPDILKSAAPAPVSLPVESTVVFGPYLIKMSKCRSNIALPDQNIYNLAIYSTLDFDKINGSIFIRTREAGDVYYTGGMHKKLKKLLGALKIPLHLRDAFPLFCDSEGIVWVPGLRPRDGCGGNASAENPVYIGVWCAET